MRVRRFDPISAGLLLALFPARLPADMLYVRPYHAEILTGPAASAGRIRVLLPRGTAVSATRTADDAWMEVASPVAGRIRAADLAADSPPKPKALFPGLPAIEAIPLSPPADVAYDRNIVYGRAGGADLTLNLARPKGAAGPLPCIVALHGGGWALGNKDMCGPSVWRIARRGFVAAAVGYRLAPTNRFPAAVEDAKCAVRFLRAHAADYGIDPDRIGAWGGSAGGHLALMLGVTDAKDGLEGDGGWAGVSSRVRAAVSCSGPTDLAADGWPPTCIDLLKGFLGGSREELPEVYRRASPVTYLGADDPPLLLQAGTRDPLVPDTQARRMIETMAAKNVPGRLDLIVGGGHALESPGVAASAVPEEEETIAFFGRHLKP